MYDYHVLKLWPFPDKPNSLRKNKFSYKYQYIYSSHLTPESIENNTINPIINRIQVL